MDGRLEKVIDAWFCDGVLRVHALWAAAGGSEGCLKGFL